MGTGMEPLERALKVNISFIQLSQDDPLYPDQDQCSVGPDLAQNCLRGSTKEENLPLRGK